MQSQSGTSSQDRGSLSQDISQADEEQIKAQYKTDKEACNSMTGNTKDICISEAKAREKVAKAEFEARRKNTDKARYDVLVTRAETEYEVAKERCDDRSGNDKDVCLKDAKAELVSKKAEAKNMFKTSEAMENAEGQVTQQSRSNTRGGSTGTNSTRSGGTAAEGMDGGAGAGSPGG